MRDEGYGMRLKMIGPPNFPLQSTILIFAFQFPYSLFPYHIPHSSYLYKMKVTITVKEINPDFDRELADKEFDGKESEENVLYNWEDEFDIQGDVKELKIRNNVPFDLHAQIGEEQKTYTIDSMMVVDLILSGGATTSCAFSRSLVKDTKKITHPKGDVHFYVFLKGGKKIVSPVTGIYIAEKDFPKELPIPEEDEITSDEEE